MDVSRRKLLARLPRFALAIAGADLLAASAARADALVTKDSVSYQTTPSNGQQCSLCTHFVPGAAGGPGTCKVVAGSISPTGYCLAFTAS